MPITKEILSGSTRGRAIQVGATASAGTTIHTTGTSATTTDEIWLYATNNDTVARNLTIEFGTTGTASEINSSIPAKTALSLIVPGLVLRGDGSTGEVVRAFSSETNVISVVGYVNRMTP